MFWIRIYGILPNSDPDQTKVSFDNVWKNLQFKKRHKFLLTPRFQEKPPALPKAH